LRREASTPGVQRKLAAILAADVAGYSRLVGADEEGTLARLRALRQELIEPVIAAHGGRTFKLTGDGRLIEFASVVDALRSALEVQRGMMARNANIAQERRIEFRVGIHLGDVIVESDGDLMGDGVNVAARLEGIAESGGICLSNAAYEQVRDKVAAEFADLGEKELKNIARPVRVYAVQVSGTSKTPTRQGFGPSTGASPPLTPLSSPPRLSIIVLPFANIGGDPEQDYFVDGVTESLTTDLSRISGSFVIARNSAFSYKGKSPDVRQIGRELGVRYVLEGSVQRGGNRLRVNVQLIDAETGNHLWAERFDKPVADLFDMQDEIVARLANQLGTELVAAEARRAERAPRPDSMDLYFQGMACVNKGWTSEYIAQARGFFERALALDPGNIEALVGTAWVELVRGTAVMTDDRAVRLAAAEAALTKALSLAPNHAWAHCLLGSVQIFTNREAQGIAECERALALDRNLAMAHGQIGFAKYFLGRGEETEPHVQEALRLSPRDTNAHVWLVFAGFGKLQIGAYEEAAARFRQSVEMNRNIPLAHFALGATLANLGRLDQAQSAVQAGLALDPAFTIRRFLSTARSDNPAVRAQGKRVVDGMRKAGVPEG
jgi:TolB-like protein/class 3 adenylate cyclase